MTSTLPLACKYTDSGNCLGAHDISHFQPCCSGSRRGRNPGFFQQHIWGNGTLSYGGAAEYPGFPGFGLSFHKGYGYGGNALGTGPSWRLSIFWWPRISASRTVLRRFGGIAPFLFYGGPGYPRCGYSNYFTEIAPLVSSPSCGGWQWARAWIYGQLRTVHGNASLFGLLFRLCRSAVAAPCAGRHS